MIVYITNDNQEPAIEWSDIAVSQYIHLTQAMFNFLNTLHGTGRGSWGDHNAKMNRDNHLTISDVYSLLPTPVVTLHEEE